MIKKCLENVATALQGWHNPARIIKLDVKIHNFIVFF